jgi:hypothetical protein
MDLLKIHKSSLEQTRSDHEVENRKQRVDVRRNIDFSSGITCKKLVISLPDIPVVLLSIAIQMQPL